MAARIPIPITPEAFQKKKERVVEIELPTIVPAGSDNNNNNDNGDNGNENETNQLVEEEIEEVEEDEELSLEEHAMIVTAILKPVGITMLIVVWVVYALNMATAAPTHIAFMVYKESSSDSTVEKLTGSIINAVIFVVLIVLVTFVLVILYKYRCLKIIFGWLIAATGILLGFFGGALFVGIVFAYSFPLDWITFSVVVWNFMIVGMVAIFWYSPVKVTQAYLIAISALLACFFTRLPEWTTWSILVAVAIYDLFAVLCPRGPLKILVDLSHERQEPIPALLYNGSVSCMAMDETDYFSIEDADDTDDETDNVAQNQQNSNDDSAQPQINNNNNNNNSRVNQNLQAEEEEEEEEEVIEDLSDKIVIETEEESEQRSVKLGLGDFVFYSVLMGRAALYDITTVFTCFIAIITGLFFTLILLAIFKRALPALPFSILLGLIFFLLTKLFLVPFVLFLGTNSIVI